MQVKALLGLSKLSAQSEERCAYIKSDAQVNIWMMLLYECKDHRKWFEWVKWNTTPLKGREEDQKKANKRKYENKSLKDGLKSSPVSQSDHWVHLCHYHQESDPNKKYQTQRFKKAHKFQKKNKFFFEFFENLQEKYVQMDISPPHQNFSIPSATQL